MDRRIDKNRDEIVQQAQLLKRAGDVTAAERYLRASGFSAPTIMRILAVPGNFHSTRISTDDVRSQTGKGA